MKFCHYGCEMLGCQGVTREDMIEWLVDDYNFSHVELSDVSDWIINDLVSKLTECQPGMDHIRINKKESV